MFESQFELFDEIIIDTMYDDSSDYFDEFYYDIADISVEDENFFYGSYEQGSMHGTFQGTVQGTTQLYELDADTQGTFQGTVQGTTQLHELDADTQGTFQGTTQLHELDTEASVAQSDILDPLERVLDDVYYFFTGNSDIVTENHFNSNGTFDEKNNLIVEGNVAHDLQFTQQQTHGSCSLMAQEQFVHRYTGQAVPEEYLEWQAEKWGVYSPDLGTDEDGQVMVLEHFNIPHDRIFDANASDIDNAISTGNDVIIGVDAREFYDDSSIPPESGHAVAIVGRGIDPETSEVAGYYVTDSNYPESARFVSVEKMESSMLGDMITIPEKKIA